MIGNQRGIDIDLCLQFFPGLTSVCAILIKDKVGWIALAFVESIIGKHASRIIDDRIGISGNNRTNLYL